MRGYVETKRLDVGEAVQVPSILEMSRVVAKVRSAKEAARADPMELAEVPVIRTDCGRDAIWMRNRCRKA